MEVRSRARASPRTSRSPAAAGGAPCTPSQTLAPPEPGKPAAPRTPGKPARQLTDDEIFHFVAKDPGMFFEEDFYRDLRFDRAIDREPEIG
jgi:hypothetical protein